MRELTEKEKEQRQKLDDRFRSQGRKYAPVSPMDIGLPAFDESDSEGKREV